MTTSPTTAHARMNAGGCFAYKPQPQPGGQCFDCGKPITDHTHIFTVTHPRKLRKSQPNIFRQELLRRPAAGNNSEVCS